MPLPGDSQTHVVVGAGQAGICAAGAMREAGFAGRIVVVGAEPHAPYERPPLSKEMLTGGPSALRPLRPACFAEEQRIELRLGARAEAIDVAAQRLELADGSAIAYDRLLLATGGQPRRLGVPGDEHVLYLRTLDDSVLLHRRLTEARHVVVIGAGVIGLEAASSARKLGREVTVLEATGSVMQRVLALELAPGVEALHQRAGVTLRFGVRVAAIERDADGLQVVLKDGGVLAADCIVAGIGLEREIALAARAGLAVDGGIIVDEFARTSADGIFAVGDVASFWYPPLQRRLRLEAWQHAQNHGIAAARAMCGIMEPYVAVPWFWTDQHGVNFQFAGLPLDADRTVVRGSVESGRCTAFHLAGERIVGATTVNQGRDMRPCLTMIQAGTTPDPAALADPAIALKTLMPRTPA